MALATMAGRSDRRPSMRAASALSSTVSPTGDPSGTPMMPACRNRARNDRTAAIAHTHGVQAAHRDAEQRRPVGPVGRGPHGDADVGEAQEQRHGHHGQRRRAPTPPGSRRRTRAGRCPSATTSGTSMRVLSGSSPHRRGHHQRPEREQLGEADGGHGQDQAARAEEAPDDRQLDDARRPRPRPPARRPAPARSAGPRRR